jgi:hypothetical protein
MRSPTSLEDLATYFFTLPHPRFTHDGVENHYHFSICPAAYADPEDDIVQVVKVGNNFTHIGGPMQLRVLPLKKKVDTVLRFLFVSFLNGLPTRLNHEIQQVVRELGGFARFSKGISTTGTFTGGCGYGDGTSRLIRLTLAEDRKVAPFSWSTDDAELAQAMSTRLQEFAGLMYGNHPLLKIRLADERDNRAAMITYIAFQHSLIRGIKKHTTDVLRDTSAATWPHQDFDSVPPTPVTLAGRTLVTTVIEEEDEDDDGVVELPSKGVVNAQAKLFNPDPDGDFPDPSTYYNTKAYRVQGACSLATSVNLVLPEGGLSQSEAMSIM